MGKVPATWFVVLEGVFVLAVFVGVGAGVMVAWPSTDTGILLARVGGAWLVLLAYAVAGWYATASHDRADHYGMKVGPLRMDNPLSYRDDYERARYNLWFWLLPGKLLAGAVLDVLGWVGASDPDPED